MKKIKLTVMATVFSVALGLSSGVVNAEVVNEEKTSSNINITRISGEDRYQTSLNIANYFKNNFNEYETISIASGEQFSDALSAGILSSEFKSPLLLVKENNVPEEILNSLSNSKKLKMFLVGGEKSISKSVEKELSTYSKEVVRFAGEDRYETSSYVYVPINNIIYKCPFIGDESAAYNGKNYPDALVATPFMYQYNQVKSHKFPLYACNPEKKIEGIKFVFGGENSFPKFKEEQRISGEDRYKTAVNVAKAYKTILEKDFDTVVLANGQDYPDALASSPLSTMKSAPILLTSPKTLNEDTKQYIKSNPNIKNVIIVGGENSVSMEVENELKQLK